MRSPSPGARRARAPSAGGVASLLTHLHIALGPTAARILGYERQWRAYELLAAHARQRQAELCTVIGLSPRLQPPAVQRGVLECDRKTQTRSTTRAHP